MQILNLSNRNLNFRAGLILAFFTLMTVGLQAQTAFHRLYPPLKSKKVATITSAQIKDGHFVSMHLEVEPDTNSNLVYGDTLILTSFEAKGDIAWSNYIELDASFDKIYKSLSSIVQGSNDSIYYSFVAEQADNPIQIIGSLDSRGNSGFLKTYSLVDTVRLTGTDNLLVNMRQSLFNAFTVDDAAERAIYLSRLDYKGDTLWTKSLQLDVADNKVSLSALRTSKDDIVAVGNYVIDGTKPFVVVTDTLGNPTFSKTYLDTLSKTSQMTGLDVRRLADSSFVLVGNIIEPTNIPEYNRTSGFVIKTDKQGNVEWSGKVAFPGDSMTTLSYCTINRNNDIILGGLTLGNNGDDDYFYLIRMTANGEVVWQKKYVQAEDSQDFFGGAMYEALDWGFVYMATGVNDKGRVGPAFIKTTTDGTTTCELDITEDILTPYTFVADTLSWNVKDVFDTKPEDVGSKTGIYVFDVPVIGLELKTFCPNEPIDWTFDASVDNNASTYEWSDGSTSPTLRVFDEGEYSVTVTMNDNVCYMLCDTAKLDRYGLPQASIDLSLGNFCVNGMQTLQMGYGPGHPDIKSITWSTGETNIRFIEIAQPGSYSVTVVDACDETATATIDVGEFPKIITVVEIEDHINVDCAYGNLSGSLEATGNSSGLGDESYSWNIGSFAKRVIVENVETLFYSVTVTDQCGNTASASKTYEIKGENKLTLTIVEDDSRKCTHGEVRLNAFLGTQSTKIQYLWNYNDSTTAAIVVTEPGVYSVTITDACGNTLTASHRVEFNGRVDNLQPNVAINYDSLCNLGKTLLQTNFNPNGDYKYLWSTGDTTINISIDKIGTYRVTISDHCNNNYEFPFNVNRRLDLQVSPSVDLDALCNIGRSELRLTVIPDNNYSYQWSTGDLTKNTFIETQGNYFVTITDFCDSQSFTFEAVRPWDFEVSENIDYDKLCVDGNTSSLLSIEPAGNYKYQWSTGATTKDISIDKTGTYEVTITTNDFCENSHKHSFKVDFDFDFNDLIYAKIFFPDGTFRPDMVLDTSVTNSDSYKNAELYNRTFGPVSGSEYQIDRVSDYKLYIFNRWGQEVFVGSHVNDEWDGTFNGQPAPSDTYLWVAKYKHLCQPKEAKGSVTLIRL